jgi:hypothetical protein
MSKDQPHCGSADSQRSACDEHADCGSGEVCCYVPRSDPTDFARNVCRKAKCAPEEVELCLPGGSCLGKKKCKAVKAGERFSMCR